jgi:hypothetical protein
MQDTAYEPLNLNVLLLGGLTEAEATSRSGEKTSTDNAIVVVEGEPPSKEPPAPTAVEQPLLKKRRTIRFAE